jgi:uncharacterized protein YndB with AHSA1/START domain
VSGNEKVEIRVTIAAPVEEVWPALRDPAEIRRWFGWDYDGLEAEIQEIFVEGPHTVEEPRRIAWPTGDEFELEPRGSETVVRVTRPAPADADEWDEVHEGWTVYAQQLRFALERHRGADRRAFVLAGPEDTPAVLGLDRLAALAPGERYELDSPLGGLSGVLWYRSPHQVGVSVDAYGDGLIVAAGGESGKVLVTTYGLSDADHEQLRARWLNLGRSLGLGAHPLG